MAELHQIRIALVDDAPDMLVLLQAVLASDGRELVSFSTADDLLASPELDSFDLVVTDLFMPGIDGLDLLRRMRRQIVPPEVVLVTGAGGIPDAVEAMRAGAFDVVEKQAGPQRIALVVDRAAEFAIRSREFARRQQAIVSAEAFESVIGESPRFRDACNRARQAASTSATVLITGESGTGKEVLATAIHRASAAASGPFIALNCAAVTTSLIESELFGHEKGSFTGAVKQHRGCFERASGGTLFLDEIGDLDTEVQARLLRVLQERRLRRVGGEHEVSVNCRLLAATNVDLAAAVEDGRFRRDLYYRLKVIEVEMPPLRDRPDDILPLAMHFVRVFGERHNRPVNNLTPAAQAELLAWDWPGNVRELQNVIESAVVFCSDSALDVRHLPAAVTERPATRPGNADASAAPEAPAAPVPAGHAVLSAGSDMIIAVGTPMEQIERTAIEATLDLCDGVKERAAQVLGIGVRTLYRKLKQYREE